MMILLVNFKQYLETKCKIIAPEIIFNRGKETNDSGHQKGIYMYMYANLPAKARKGPRGRIDDNLFIRKKLVTSLPCAKQSRCVLRHGVKTEMLRASHANATHNKVLLLAMTPSCSSN
jgi:hypothetical protein